jgi:hypothetical protein
MLQIITGKFFKSKDWQVYEGKGVLYSNYRWFLPFETCIGRFEPLGTRASLIGLGSIREIQATVSKPADDLAVLSKYLDDHRLFEGITYALRCRQAQEPPALS